MQKLILAMAGHAFVQVPVKLDAEDDGSHAMIEELLRTGQVFSNVRSTIFNLRARFNHDRLTEVVLKTIESEVLSTYLDVLVQAEKACLRGDLNLLRLRYLISEHMRSSNEIQHLMRLIKLPNKIVRSLADMKHSSCGLTERVISIALEQCLIVLRDAVETWIKYGFVPRSSEPYFFLTRTSSVTLVQDGKRQAYSPKYALNDYQVVFDRVPIDLRFSLDWASRICFLGNGSGIVQCAPGISDVYNEIEVNRGYRLVDARIAKLYSSQCIDELSLVRDSFFLGRGELFRAAMDVSGDFEEACTITNNASILDFVAYTPRSSSKSSLGHSAVLFSGGEMDANGQVETRSPSSNCWLVFQEKLCAGVAFDAKIECVFVESTTSVIFSIDPMMDCFMNNSCLPNFALDISAKRCTLYLNGLFASESVYVTELSLQQLLRFNIVWNQRTLVLKQVGDDEDSPTLLQFSLEDDLIMPQWVDPLGQAFVGVIFRNALAGNRLASFVFASNEDSYSLPRLSLLRPSERVIPLDVYATLNAVFQFLFRVKTTLEMLSKAWSRRKGDITFNLVRFDMVQTCTNLYQFLQIDIIQTGFDELINMLSKPSGSVEFRQNLVRQTLENMSFKCGFNNSAIHSLVLQVVRICEEFAISVLRGLEINLRDAHRRFGAAMDHLFQGLDSANTTIALDFKRALDPLGRYSSTSSA